MKEKRAFVLEDQKAIAGAYKEILSHYDLVIKTSVSEAFIQIEKDCKFDLFVIAAYVASRGIDDEAGGELQNTAALVARINCLIDSKVPVLITSDSKSFRDEIKTFNSVKACEKYGILEALREISKQRG